MYIIILNTSSKTWMIGEGKQRKLSNIRISSGQAIFMARFAIIISYTHFQHKRCVAGRTFSIGDAISRGSRSEVIWPPAPSLAALAALSLGYLDLGLAPAVALVLYSPPEWVSIVKCPVDWWPTANQRRVASGSSQRPGDSQESTPTHMQ